MIITFMRCSESLGARLLQRIVLDGVQCVVTFNDAHTT